MTTNQKWGTTTTIADLAQWLEGKRKVVILTHTKPDGDALGSTLAVLRALNLKAKNESTRIGVSMPAPAVAWYFGPQPPWASGLIGHDNVLTPETSELSDMPEPDAIIILDTGSWSQLEPVREWLASRTDRAAVIDHHVQGDPDVAPRRVVETSSAAACQIAADLCRRILGLESIAKLPGEIAQVLYLGIAMDTGWFKHSNVSPGVLRTAASLLETGVDHARLFQFIEQRDRPTRLKLLARALSSLELVDQDRIAVMTLTRKDFADTGTESGDAGGFTDYCNSVESVRVVAVLSEVDGKEYGKPGATVTKISMRSKSGPSHIDVNVVAKGMGGGGHVHAAGARLDLPLMQAKARVIEEIRKQAVR